MKRRRQNLALIGIVQVFYSLALLFCLSFSLFGCVDSYRAGKQTAEIVVDDSFRFNSKPALLAAPAADSVLIELKALIAAAIGQSDVHLANNVFQKSSIVALGKKDFTGRERGVKLPERFQLRITPNGCVLEYLDKDKAWRLSATTCRTE